MNTENEMHGLAWVVFRASFTTLLICMAAAIVYPIAMYLYQVLFSEVNPEAIRSAMNDTNYRIMLGVVMIGVTSIQARKYISEQKGQ